jgi:hypothetical protein
MKRRNFFKRVGAALAGLGVTAATRRIDVAAAPLPAMETADWSSGDCCATGHCFGAEYMGEVEWRHVDDDGVIWKANEKSIRFSGKGPDVKIRK